MDDSYPNLLQEVCHELVSKPELVVQLHSLIQQLSSHSGAATTSVPASTISGKSENSERCFSSSSGEQNRNSSYTCDSNEPTTYFSSSHASHGASVYTGRNVKVGSAQRSAISGRRMSQSNTILPSLETNPLSVEQELQVERSRISFLEKELAAQCRKREKDKKAFQKALVEMQRTHLLEIAAKRFEKVVESSKMRLNAISQSSACVSEGEMEKCPNGTYPDEMATFSKGSTLGGSSDHVLPLHHGITPSPCGPSLRLASPSPLDITRHFNISTSLNLPSDHRSVHHSHVSSDLNPSGEFSCGTRSGRSSGFLNKEFEDGNAIIKVIDREEKERGSNREVYSHFPSGTSPNSSTGRAPFSDHGGASFDALTHQQHQSDADHASLHPLTSSWSSSSHWPILEPPGGSDVEDHITSAAWKGSNAETAVSSTTATASWADPASRLSASTKHEKACAGQFKQKDREVSITVPTSSVSPAPTAPILVRQKEGGLLGMGRKRTRRPTPQSPAMTYADKLHAASGAASKSVTEVVKDYHVVQLPSHPSSTLIATKVKTRAKEGGKALESGAEGISSTTAFLGQGYGQQCLATEYEEVVDSATPAPRERQKVKGGPSAEDVKRALKDQKQKEEDAGGTMLRDTHLRQPFSLYTQDDKPSTNSGESVKKTTSFSTPEVSSCISSGGPKNMVSAPTLTPTVMIGDRIKKLGEGQSPSCAQKALDIKIKRKRIDPLFSSPAPNGGYAVDIVSRRTESRRSARLSEMPQLGRNAVSAKDRSSKSYSSVSSCRNRSRGDPHTLSPSPRNPQRGPAQPRRFVFTGLTAEEVHELEDAVASIGDDATVLQCEYDAPPPYAVTHVVSRGKPRSVKAMCGLVAGRWLVEPSYILRSVEAGFWLDEVAEGGHHLHSPPLKGVRFLLTQPDPVLREKLAQVIEYGEGEIIENSQSGSPVGLVTGAAADILPSSLNRERHQKSGHDDLVVIYSGDDLLQFAIQQL